MAYSQEEKDNIINKICTLIGDEKQSLRSALRIDGMPTFETFYRWIDADESKSKQYARAMSKRADAIFEEILNISDDQEGDVYETEDGKKITNYNVIQRARLRVDSRKWMLGKMNPKKYSDKIQIDTTEFKEQPLFPDVQEDDSDK